MINSDIMYRILPYYSRPGHCSDVRNTKMNCLGREAAENVTENAQKKTVA